MSSPRVATFDCYGTLIDWEGGVGAFLYELARRHGDDPPPGRELREAGLRLWIISNTDRAIIEHSLRHLEVDFAGFTVAEDCRAYKPSTIPFETALRDIGAPREEILHVAFGFKYDLAAAQRHGMRTVWVNRHRDPAPGPERRDHEWDDLWPLAELRA